ncbi:fibrobacter succinogenes major paralogous domain-containing protein [Algoriphagus winogradskyi]|uniref:Major paralogous domain-containing protein n=1 Tax=Algoriphagus winogradskyi TaxID=237017 RepID=A0ABY1P4C2_9BACT|nr:fibrobacter succinogenes major paralogous domain-containing protein [Algoriphagus winogradskyi]SMP26050.1 major paralogous domain-containing protein [Algoriphagus winogradskyi]
MSKLLSLTLILLLLFSCQEPEDPNLSGIPENGIEIGNQIWMKKNLEVKKFKNGDDLFQATNQGDWEDAYLNQIPAWSYYEDLDQNGEIYGLIYNYFAIVDPRGLAPKDWKIPSISDWNDLFIFNGGTFEAGKKLKSTEYWLNKSGTNTSGFNALPGGERYIAGYFGSKGLIASFWTSTTEQSGDIITVGISDLSEDSKIFVSTSNAAYFSPSQELPGYYLRCIKE